MCPFFFLFPLILLLSCVHRWGKRYSPRRSGRISLVWCLRSLQQLGPPHRLPVPVLQALLSPHLIIQHQGQMSPSRTQPFATGTRLWSKAVCSAGKCELAPVRWFPLNNNTTTTETLSLHGAFWESKDVS